MFLKIRKKIESEFLKFLGDIERSYRLDSISPLLYKAINEFAGRSGKRIRPTLFVVSYLGYCRKPAPLLYRSASSLEMLHDFMLVHDDIIDRSDTRRGKPSMHVVFDKYIRSKQGTKFSGEDLAIIAGDVMYAMALHAFLSIKEKPENKEAAFRKLIEAALYTGTGEFNELILSIKKIENVTKEDIYRVYDLKTANYTFSTPLVMGAILAGAKKSEVNRLFDYGICLGRAFQIKDDILGTFSEESESGKSNTTDLQEAKNTILVWYAYKNSNPQDKLAIKKILSAKRVSKKELLSMRSIISRSGSLSFARSEIAALRKKAEKLGKNLEMKNSFKLALDRFSKEILQP